MAYEVSWPDSGAAYIPGVVAGSRFRVAQPDLRLGGRSQQVHFPICTYGLENSGRLFQQQSYRGRADPGRLLVDWNDVGATAI